MKKLILTFGFIVCFLTNFAQETGTFTDSRDGKVYKTVKIGTQIWMAENLAFKTKRGSWAYENDENNVAMYGRLYNWETAIKVCPEGWHLPSEEEWTILINYLGGKDSASIKMKSVIEWEFHADSHGTNESGFNVLPAGCRTYYKTYHDLHYSTGFWTSNINKSENANVIGINFSQISVDYLIYNRLLGCSIRALKNE